MRPPSTSQRTVRSCPLTLTRSPFRFVGLNGSGGTLGGLFLDGGGGGSPELIVEVEEGVGEGVEGKYGCLEVPVEVDGGVVGEERRTEIHVPSHFLLL